MAQGICPVGVIQANFTGLTTQNGRIFRNGSASSCPGKAYPGIFNVGTTYHYETFTYPNTSGSTACVTINFDPNAGAAPCGANAHASAYLNTYDPNDPNNQAANFVGDVGSSATQPFSFNVPGNTDLVLVVTNTAFQSTCNFAFEVVNLTCGDNQVIHSGDFNGDGRSDILLIDATRQLQMYFMNGASVLGQVPTGAPLGANMQVDGIGDFNKDGRADILLRDTTANTLMTRFMSGASVLSQVTLATTPPADTVGVADLNGDGRADIVFQDGSTGQITVWIMTGASILAQVAIGPNPNTGQVQAVRDTNGDGRADILLREGDQLKLWIMNGASILSQPNVGTVLTASTQVVALGDLNGDSRADILLRNGDDLIVRILSGASVLSQITLAQSAAGLDTYGLGDFNGDKRADVLHRYSGGGALRMWVMTGASILAQVNLSAVPPATTEVIAPR